jgi:hypothetical protein
MGNQSAGSLNQPSQGLGHSPANKNGLSRNNSGDGKGNGDMFFAKEYGTTLPLLNKSECTEKRKRIFSVEEQEGFIRDQLNNGWS